MESSQTHLRLGVIRPSRRYRSISRYLRLPLRNIRLLLDSKMANLSMERRIGLPWKILAIPRRILQHHPRTTCERRDHQRTIRTADARPTTTQLRPIDSQMGLPLLFRISSNRSFPE